MNWSLVRAVFAVVVVWCAASADAELIYSFEEGPQGFGPNGFPLPTVAVDTVGATEGAQSLLFSLGQNQTFSGALTQVVDQALLLSPDTNAIQLDLTITPNGTYNGAGFANLGVTYFGSIPSQGVFGVPVQTNGASERSVDLAPGTYTLTIPLISTAGEPFREAFGGPGDLENVSGFQFYINKTGDAPITVYIDNVQTVIPEPASGALVVGVGALMLRRRRR